jgi:hypothetical protein
MWLVYVIDDLLEVHVNKPDVGKIAFAVEPRQLALNVRFT